MRIVTVETLDFGVRLMDARACFRRFVMTVNTKTYSSILEQEFVVRTVWVMTFDTTVVFENRIMQGDLGQVLYRIVTLCTNLNDRTLQLHLISKAVVLMARIAGFVLERLVVEFLFELLVEFRMAIETVFFLLVAFSGHRAPHQYDDNQRQKQ